MKPDDARIATGPRVTKMVLTLVMCVLVSGPLTAQVSGGSGDEWKVPARASRKPNPIERTS